MNRKIIEDQFNKYLKIYHFEESDRLLYNDLKKNYRLEEMDLSLCSETFFNFLLNESDLNIETKAKITLDYQELIKNFPQKNEVSESTPISGIDKMFDFYTQHLKDKSYNFQTQFFGKTLPIQVIFEIKNATKYNPRHISISYNITLCASNSKQITNSIYHKDIVAAKAKYKKITFYELFKEFNLYKLEIDLNEYELLLEKTNELKKQNGKQFLTNQKVIESKSDYRGNLGFFSCLLINYDSFSKVIIETDLDKNQREISHTEPGDSHIDFTTPYLRIFSLARKSYFFIHIEDLLSYTYDKEAFSKLKIPDDTRNLLHSIFQSNIKDYYSDFIKSKHGGMVVLAEGSTGVGKTSTAEVYAELLEKPLYMVQVAELGMDTKSIEDNLSIIFNRVQKWNAVLLFDEIDVFLYRRGSDVWQAARVGVFLRLLDYFSGLIFFTTNRSSVLDSAILSRISVKIKYEKLSEETQLEIWKSKLNDAQITIDSLNKLPLLELNGRQIKNAIRVAKVLYGNKLKENEIANLIEKYIV